MLQLRAPEQSGVNSVSAVDIRTWFWLQEKWDVRRLLLWQTSVNGRDFHQAGADGRVDEQVFHFRHGKDGKNHPIPSIRAEMLHDGVEDREYFLLLKDYLAKSGSQRPDSVGASPSQADKATLYDRAAEFVTIPDSLVRAQYEMSGDVQQLLSQCGQMADVIEAMHAEPTTTGKRDE